MRLRTALTLSTCLGVALAVSAPLASSAGTVPGGADQPAAAAYCPDLAPARHTVSGRVVNVDGRTQDNVQVTAFPVRAGSGPDRDCPAATALTYQRGGFALRVPTGEYLIQFTETPEWFPKRGLGTLEERHTVDGDLDLRTVKVLFDAPDLVQLPELSGRPAPGQKMFLHTGLWANLDRLGGPEFAYQWLRNGEPIPGATEMVYWVTPADVGAQLQGRQYARTTRGYGTYADSLPVTVTKAIPTVQAWVGDGSVRVGSQPKLVVRVFAPRQPTVTGTVTVFKAGRQLARGVLRLRDRGRVVLALPKLPIGTHRLLIQYSGSRAFAPTTATVRFRVSATGR